MKYKIIFAMLIAALVTSNLNGQDLMLNQQAFSLINADAEMRMDNSSSAGLAYDFNGSLQNNGKKSVFRAMLYSLILPGAGEYYLGRTGYAKFFFSMEILAWGGLLANDWYADHLVDEYRTFARQHAGLQPAGKDAQYWIDIGKYDSIYDFNEKRRQQRFYSEVYEDSPENFWQWDTRANRFTYDARRLRANEVANQDVYFYAAVVLNHLVSGINALRLVRKHNRSFHTFSLENIRVNAYRLPDGSRFYGLSYRTAF